MFARQSTHRCLGAHQTGTEVSGLYDKREAWLLAKGDYS